MSKSKRKVDPLIGRRVRINDDADNHLGDPHPHRGQEATLVDRSPGSRGQYQATVVADSASVSLVMDCFTVLPLDGSDVPSLSPALRDDGELLKLERTAIVPSRTNPRTRFDADFIEELAASIKVHGIAQPILVRRLPCSRVDETYLDRMPGEGLPTHEIIAGEQRFRAARIAGLRTMPVLVRDLTDGEVLELQLVENLKRRDLHPMEEAEGYERLMEELHLSAEDIADKIGKGRSYVYKTLSLLRLTSEARQALYDGRLSRSTAELVAARPESLQAQVLKEITAPDFRGEGMSYRVAKAHIEDRYMLQLGGAPFAIADAELLAGVGACGACPKRSGANPDLFEDVKNADTCTDPTCFGQKKEAHYVRIRIQAEAKGQTVLTGREAREAMQNGQLKGFRRLDEVVDAQVTGKYTDAFERTFVSLRDVLGEDIPATTLVEDPQTHEMIEVLPTAVVGHLLKSKAPDRATPAAEPVSEAEAKRNAQTTYERTWRQRAIAALYERINDGSQEGVGTQILRVVSQLLLPGLSKAEREHACELLGLGRIATEDALRTHIQESAMPDVVLMVMAMEHDMRGASNDPPSPAAGIEAVSVDCNTSVAPIQAKVKREMKAAARVSAEADAAAAPSTGKGKARRAAPKTTTEEATAGIAAAMQQAEETTS